MKLQLSHFAIFLMVFGTVCFLMATANSFIPYMKVDHGSLRTVSFISFLSGIAVVFPVRKLKLDQLKFNKHIGHYIEPLTGKKSFVPVGKKQNQINAIKSQEKLQQKRRTRVDPLQTKLKILEETYRTISRNLHDNIGSNISTAMLLLYKDEKITSTEEEANRQEALSILDKTVDDLKNIARSLNPDYLFKIGLSEAIQQRMDQLKRAKKYELDLFIERFPQQFEREKQVILFYFFQEAINNINSHANARKILVRLQYQTDKLLLQVSDDGKGMELRDDSVIGAGLINMKNYAEMIGANLEIQSKPEKGTDIKIMLPFPFQKSMTPILGIDLTAH